MAKKIDQIALQAGAEIILSMHDFPVATSTVADVKTWVEEGEPSRAAYALVCEQRSKKPRATLLRWIASKLERPEAPEKIQVRTGRPGILTAEVQATIVESILAGNFEVVAARAAGVASSTFHSWTKRGREYRERLQSGGAKVDVEEPYLEFVEAVETARAQVETVFVGMLRGAAQGGALLKSVETRTQSGDRVVSETYAAPSVSAMSFYLERSHPERWGRHRIEIGGPDGAPISVEVQATAVEMLTEKIASLAERGTAA